MPTWIIVAMIGGLFVFGVVGMALPLKWWLRARRRMRLGGVADGWVDRQGRSHRVSSRFAHSPAQHAIGDRVLVAYEPASPEDAAIVTDTRPLVSLALFGLCMLVMALLLWWGLWIGAFV